MRNDITASPRAADPDGDDLDYHYEWAINGSAIFSDDAILPKEEFKRGDEITLRVTASDGTDESGTLESQPIRVVNVPPMITSTPKGFEDDGSFRYQVVASDPDGDPRLRYRLLEAPEGMAMDRLNGTITWTPAGVQAGNHPVVVEVDDMAGGTSKQSFEVRVAFEGGTPADQAN